MIELVVKLLKAKLLLTEPPPLPVNSYPLILLTNILVALTYFVKSELVVRLLKAKLLLTEPPPLPVNSYPLILLTNIVVALTFPLR